MKAPILAVAGCLAGAMLFGCAENPEPAASSTDSQPKSETTKPVDTPKATEPSAEPAASKLPTTPKDGDDVAVLDTAKGKIVIMFYPEKAPKTVQNFEDLANAKFYDGTRFHRCITDFMVQGGDPLSKDMSKSGVWGTGGHMVNGKEANVPDEFTDINHVRGIVSMANTGSPNSGSSQFFIVQKDYPSLNGSYSAFGYVVQGMDVVDDIVKTGPADHALNGVVKPADAVVLKTVRIEKWPLK